MRGEGRTVTCDVADIAPAGVRQITADVFVPPSTPGGPLVVLVCTPGGGGTRRYFDLDVAGDSGTYSMAGHLAGAGFLVVTLDPAGVGDSDRPDDGWVLTPEVVADVNAKAVDVIAVRLRAGTLTAQLPPQPDVVLVGVGHSAGGLLTVVQQARHRSFDAIAVLGYHGAGLPDVLTDEMRAFANEPAALRSELPDLARSLFGEPLPISHGPAPAMLLHGDPPAAVMDALVETNGALLALVGMASLIPGSIDDSLAVVDVPVFIAAGDHDITARVHGIATQFPASTDVTLVELHDAGHLHNIADSRAQLWDRLARWASTVPVADGRQAIAVPTAVEG